MSSFMSIPSSTEGVESLLMYDFRVLIGVTAALVVVSSLSVGLRCYVRGFVTRTFGWDDWTMVAAQVAYIVTGILVWIATSAEMEVVSTGKLTMMSIAELVQMIRYSNAAYTLTMVIVKISIGIFFLKLFSTTSFKWQRYLILGLMGLSTAVGGAYLIMTFATCGIMVKSQKSTIMHTGSDWCPIQDAFVDVSITYSAMNIFTDFIFTGLAILALWRAKMDLGTKISAGALLIIGSLGCVASIVRIIIQLPLTNIELSGVLLGQWSNIEAGMCITAASLMCLRPLVQPAVARVRSTLGSFSKGSRSGSNASSLPSKNNFSLVKSVASQESDIEKGNAVLITKTFEITDHEGRWSSES